MDDPLEECGVSRVKSVGHATPWHGLSKVFPSLKGALLSPRGITVCSNIAGNVGLKYECENSSNDIAAGCTGKHDVRYDQAALAR